LDSTTRGIGREDKKDLLVLGEVTFLLERGHMEQKTCRRKRKLRDHSKKKGRRGE